MIPYAWTMDGAPVRIVCHWTGGEHHPSPADLAHYHILIDGGGGLHRGTHPIAANDRTADGTYAAHVRGLNTRSIGIALCGMRDAVHRPFDPGPSQITEAQWSALVSACAELAMRYGIRPDVRGILTHAEVSHVYPASPQAGKWDIMVDPTRSPLIVEPAAVVGDRLRALIADAMRRAGPPINPPKPRQWAQEA